MIQIVINDKEYNYNDKIENIVTHILIFRFKKNSPMLRNKNTVDWRRLPELK
jgi:hypothetical protein